VNSKPHIGLIKILSRLNLKFIYLRKFKFSIMISKIKYTGILLLSIGYFLHTSHLNVGPLTGAPLLNLGCFVIAVYAIAKLLGK